MLSLLVEIKYSNKHFHKNKLREGTNKTVMENGYQNGGFGVKSEAEALYLYMVSNLHHAVTLCHY